MTSVVPVKFAYATRDLWFDQARSDAQEGDHVICSTERGTEIGLVTAPAKQVSDDELARKIGNSTLKPVLRIASDADLMRAEELAQRGDGRVVEDVEGRDSRVGLRLPQAFRRWCLWLWAACWS